jgi:DNA mismatch repair ATPase MutS
MLALLESLPAKGQALAELQRSLLTKEGERPSQAMRRFERIVSWFELRHNGLVYPFINVLFLWDIHCVMALERWKLSSGKVLRGWFQALGELEALSSLAAFAADNDDYVFPEIADEPVFEAEGLGHPLVEKGKRVSNDVHLPGPARGLLVTGSNMSGKSTLLRAMGINAVLALAGAPVAARRFRLFPLAVRTSMRISDSLSQGVSHFYAELRTLKSVLDAARGSTPVLFLLDEILHGTNSRERQIGARWVLGELLRLGALGAVSTHDEGLCLLPEPLASQLDQVHFRETMAGEEMTFDYRLRLGPVTSGNALRLMRSMGIPVPLD